MAADPQSEAHNESRFLTTRWSVVLRAARNESTRAREALSHLCEIYWYPLYAFVRRRAFSPDEAQDMTQEFFARLLERNWVSQADPQRGRFRSFLLSAMKNFMAHEWHKARTQKRGGHVCVMSLDKDTAEQRFRNEPLGPDPVDASTPESLYERRWALTLLDETLARLEEEYRRAGKVDWFEALQPALTHDSSKISYVAVAANLSIGEGAARVAVHRLRKRYRQVLRAEVANTVATPEEVDEELEHLFRVLAGG